MVFKKQKKETKEESKVEELTEEEIKTKIEEDLKNLKALEAEKEEVEAKQEVDSKAWVVQDLVISTEPVVYNAREKKSYSLIEAVVELLNRTE
jgi:hypothetical protein